MSDDVAAALRAFAQELERECRWQAEMAYRHQGSVKADMHGYTSARMAEMQGVVLGWAQAHERGTRGDG